MPRTAQLGWQCDTQMRMKPRSSRSSCRGLIIVMVTVKQNWIGEGNRNERKDTREILPQKKTSVVYMSTWMGENYFQMNTPKTEQVTFLPWAAASSSYLISDRNGGSVQSPSLPLLNFLRTCIQPGGIPTESGPSMGGSWPIQSRTGVFLWQIVRWRNRCQMQWSLQLEKQDWAGRLR